jgi:signal transduction histidine kinase
VLIMRWRRAPGGSDARRVLGWMVPVATFTAVVVPAAVVGLPDAAGVTVAQASTLLVMAVVVTASLRGRVYGIEVVLNRALVYGGLTLVVALVYAAAIGLGAALGQGGTWGDGGARAWSFVGALAAALVLAPVRLRLQAGVNRFLYGDRDEPYAVMSRVAARLGATGSAEQLLPSFVASTATALRVPYVAVELVGDRGEPRTIRHGEPSTAVDSIPLRHHGESLGALVVGRRPGQDVVPEGERRLVEDLARQASVAAANVRLTEGLRRSRERIVTGREEERRRLRRDLHDGLGPQLTGVALGLDALSGKVEPLDPALATSVDRLRDEVQEAIRDVRRLVHDLRPPRLDEVGLASAIGEVAERIGRADVEVTVTAPETLPPLTAAVEVAAYRIATEALTNVVRHSGARTCTVTVAIGRAPDPAAGARPPDRLEVIITDDGRGGTGAGTGLGVSSMRERAEEIGGTCVVERRRPRGWEVVASLPLDRP